MPKYISVIIVLLIIVSGCTSDHLLEATGSETAGSKAAVSETELARNNVWHAAKLRGVAFRAIGQEPGWLLEIVNGETILLSTDYGQTKVTYDYVEPVVDNHNRHTEFHVSEDTTIIIDGEACSDIMSGESFEVTVTIQQTSRTLHGCGRALF